MNTSYVELRLDLEETTSKKSKELGVFYAFSNDQLIEGLNALNVTKEDDKKRIVNIGQGCFILRENADKWLNLFVEYGKQLNDALKEHNIQVSKDTDVPRPEVIGFFIPIKQIKNLIVQGLTGNKVEEADVLAPEPEKGYGEDDFLKEAKTKIKQKMSFKGKK